MLTLRLQYRSALVDAILVLVALGLFLKTDPDFHLRLELGNDSKAWIYSDPQAEDKAVIMAKIQSDKKITAQLNSLTYLMQLYGYT